MTESMLDGVTIFGEGVLHSEGIVVDRAGIVYGGGRNGTMYRVFPDGRVESFAQLPECVIPNGLAMDRNGDIIICDVGTPGVLRLTQSGEVTMILDHVDDVRLTTPNFPTFDAAGDLYVSNTIDKTLKEMAVSPPDMHDPVPTGALVRLRPDGKADVVARDIHWANGLAIDPREEAVYVLQTNRSDCLRVAIRKDGTHGEPEIFSCDFPACPDGMAFASDGSLVVTLPGVIRRPGDPASGSMLTTANKIIRVDTSGSWELIHHDPQSAMFHNPTNCAFGGPDMRDLYFANLLTTHFCHVRTDVAGHPLYHQR